MKYLYQSDSLYKDKGQRMSIDLQQYIFFKWYMRPLTRKRSLRYPFERSNARYVNGWQTDRETV